MHTDVLNEKLLRETSRGNEGGALQISGREADKKIMKKRTIINFLIRAEGKRECTCKHDFSYQTSNMRNIYTTFPFSFTSKT